MLESFCRLKSHIHLIGPRRPGPKVSDALRCICCGLSTKTRQFVQCEFPAKAEGGRLCSNCHWKLGDNTPMSCLIWVDTIGLTLACDLCLTYSDQVMVCAICTRSACVTCVAIESFEYFLKSGLDSILCSDCFPESARRNRSHSEAETSSESSTTLKRSNNVITIVETRDECLRSIGNGEASLAHESSSVGTCKIYIYKDEGTSPQNSTNSQVVKVGTTILADEEECLIPLVSDISPIPISNEWCCMCLKKSRSANFKGLRSLQESARKRTVSKTVIRRVIYRRVRKKRQSR